MQLTELTIKEEIALLTLRSVATRNALSLEMAAELRDQLESVADSSVRMLLLRGEGCFMAGGDITFLEQAVSREDARDVACLIDAAHGLIDQIRALAVPVVAVVEGSCAGFGISLLSHCDFAIAEQSCVFTLAYSAIGASPDGGASYTLPRICGEKKARELLMFSEPFTAEDAMNIGLVNEVVSIGGMSACISRWQQRICLKSPHALARIKQLMNRDQNERRAHMEAEKQAFIKGIASDDLLEGIRAFMEKRPANYKSSIQD
ncbi:enoyl-CoA hydratase/isomerase family protein [Shewanella corallii]|uniref:Enoyl-CoA hydratase/isomerase family protein n=1 Tax=Shewanella corallii TaxID=560080 RepID=A0ABT0NCG0_9GAMM|nr:enoyl-CoA hydratase/isomerase family protein [Shewanella corallii]MCL2915496.1 enoyl-CoA hydratase/isomerase family protein [Shewanella corallii]